MSRKANHDLPPLEKDGIRYEQIVVERAEPLERRSGFMRAVEISTGKILWEKQVYAVERDCYLASDEVNDNSNMPPVFSPYSMDCFFLRFKFMPDQKHILVENAARERYLVNIETQEVRAATDADFPSEKIFKPYRPKYEMLPIFYRDIFFAQEMMGFYDGTGRETGYLKAYDAETQSFLWRRKIYYVPFDDELENFTDECYIVMMRFANMAKRDLLMINAREEVYYFNIRSHEVYQLKPGENYEDVRYRLRDRIRYFFEDVWDFITFSKPWREEKYSQYDPVRRQEDSY